MKNPLIIKTALAFALLLAAPFGFADVDVSAKVEQLKENKENSHSNLTQYEESNKTLEQNLRENAAAMKALAHERENLNRQMQEAKQGRGGVDAARKQVEGLIKRENERIAQDDQQIAELEKALAKVQESKKQRQTNVAAYEEKIKTIDKDSAGWNQRSQAMSDASRALKEKEDLAAADKKHLQERRVSNAKEIERWKAQTKIADRQYNGFQKLKED